MPFAMALLALISCSVGGHKGRRFEDFFQRKKALCESWNTEDGPDVCRYPDSEITGFDRDEYGHL